MRARDFITELFRPGQDINFKWSRPYKDEVNVLGKTPQGHELSINFWEITDDIVAIDFTIDADVEQDPDPDSSPKSGHELTRHGEEFAVFTQVVNAITQYLNKLPKNNVFFQVKRTEAQREPLYLKIANRVAKQLGFRHGTAQELEATNPGLYNKFDNRYSKLLWYTKEQQGVAEEMKDNEFITELWDKPYAFINPYSQDEGSGYSFQTSDGRSGKVEMDHFSLKAASWFRNLDPDSWQGVSIKFTIQGGTMTSGQRDEIRIFSTVIAAATDYFKNHNPDFVVFETDDHKKLGVYRRLIKMLTGYTPYPGWKDDALINDGIYNILNSGRIKDTIVLRRKDYIPWKKRVLGGELK